MASALVPSVRCRAKAKRSGQPCKLWAIRGGAVCRAHGGAAPQVRAAARRRVALAEAAARGDRRHPAEVLLDAIHVLDVNMRQAIDNDNGGDPEALLAAIERAATLARDALRLQVDQRQVDLQRQRVEDDQAKLVAAALRVALDAAGFTRDQQARAERELVAVLSRVDAEGERALLVEARRLGTGQRALTSGAPS